VIAVFQAEKDDGLDKLISENQTVAYCSPILASDKFDISDIQLGKLQGLSHAKAGHNDTCLHYLKTILVTAGVINKNDDYFDRIEVWSARQTPEDTPFNLNHECDQIIGHVIGSTVIDDSGNIVPEDSTSDTLPAKFHIVASTVLYKLWSKPELQEKMDLVLAEIEEGDKWFVSMECYFRGFDYALINGDKIEVVARNEKTAFLTKHLRAYGGSGVYQSKKLGRVLRNVVFSGKGLVENPANPESVILSSVASLGYKTSTGIIEKGDSKVTVEIEALNKQLEALRTENEQLKTEARANDVKQLKVQLETVQAEAKTSSEKIEGLNKQLSQLTEDKKILASEIEEKKIQAQAAIDELNQIKAAQKKAKRLVALQAALKVDSKDVEAVKASEQLNDSLAVISDEAFESFVAAQAKFTPAPLPAQSTTAPTAPQSTSKPAFNKASADEAVLETAETEKEVSLASTTTDEGAEQTRIQLASLFGTEKVKDK